VGIYSSLLCINRMALRSAEWTFSNVRMLVEYAGSPTRKIFSLRRFTGAKCANDAGEEDEKIFGSFILQRKNLPQYSGLLSSSLIVTFDVNLSVTCCKLSVSSWNTRLPLTVRWRGRQLLYSALKFFTGCIGSQILFSHFQTVPS
jgi:hypothetical protein